MKNHRIAKLFTLSLTLMILVTCFGTQSSNTSAQTPDPSSQDPLSQITAQSSCGESPETSLSMGGGGCVPPAGGWTLRNPLPVAVYGNAVASDGVYVYSAGGNRITQLSNYFGRYNPITDTWTALASLPTPVEEATAVYAEGKIFIFGGLDGTINATNLVQIFTISSGLWSIGAVMPAVRQQMGGGYWAGKIYLVAGYQTTATTSAQNQTWEYSISGNSWATKAVLPASLGGPASGVINGHLYIIGGRNNTTDAFNTNYDYDIAGNSWTTRAVIPSAINSPGSAVYRGRLWVFGGGNPFDILPDQDPRLLMTNNQTYIYDPNIDFWTTGPNQNVARSFQAGAVVRNRIVSVGGYASGSSAAVEVAIQNPLRILIVYSDSVAPKNLQSRLLLQPGVGQVDLILARNLTATSVQMSSYDLVIAYSNTIWFNASLQGDQIANYLASGGVVVGLNFDWNTTDYALSGLWTSAGYSPFSAPGSNDFVMAGLGEYQIGHPLLAGVSSLNAYYRQSLTLTAGAISVAKWNDVTPSSVVALKNRVVGVNAYLGDNPTGKWSGDFPSLIVNAGYLLRPGNGSCTSLSCPKTTTLSGSLTSTDPTLTTRILRGDPASTCAATTACSTTDTGTFPYDVHYFYNNSEAVQCISVTVDPGDCNGTNWIHVAAYSEFNPTSLCSGYLADIGGSPSTPTSFSFNVSANSLYTILVYETSDTLFCPVYTLAVSAAACAPSPIKTIYLPLTSK